MKKKSSCFLSVLLLTVLLLELTLTEAANTKVLKKRRKVLKKIKTTPVEGGFSSRTLDVEEPEEEEADEARQSRHLIRGRGSKDTGLHAQLIPSQPEPPPHYLAYNQLYNINQQRKRNAALLDSSSPSPTTATPYAIDAQDLLALESNPSSSGAAAYFLPSGVDSDYEGGSVSAASSNSIESVTNGHHFVYPYHQQQQQQQQPFHHGRHRHRGRPEALQDKTISADGGGGLLTAVIPAAMAGFVALTISAIFADQLAVNSTTNSTLPLLWQLPVEFTGKRRRKRDVYDENEIMTEGSVEDLLPPDFASFQLGTLATRFKSGMILYALMDSDADCRRKIACLIGTGARGTRHAGWITTVVKRLLPKAMRGFSDEYLRALEDRDTDEDECRQIECSKCFSV